LVLLKALVENCGKSFQMTVSGDGQLTDALKLIGSDAIGNKRVKKKLVLLLSAWREQYKDDPAMAYFANLYKQCRVSERRNVDSEVYNLLGTPTTDEDPRKAEKAKAKEEKEEKKRAKAKAKADEETRRREAAANATRTKRAMFNFERDKPKVLESIVEASRASSDLINAITLVNLEKESLLENLRVQDCLEAAKLARRTVMRYTQLVENEELIGTLIESTERIVAALETYEQMAAAGKEAKVEATHEIASKLAATTITRRTTSSDSEDARSPSPPAQTRQVHPDLADLQFGGLGAASSRLPPPIQPSKAKKYSDDDDDDDVVDRRGSLSDFSDYESSDEEMHNARAKAGPSTTRKPYATLSDDDDDVVAMFTAPSQKKAQSDDPFADPFADR